METCHPLPNGDPGRLRYIDLSFDPTRGDESARALIYRIQPKWRKEPGELEIVRFTDGITNTLLKVAKRLPGSSQSDIDRDSILLRAYGNNTEIIIDRDREARSHGLCAARGLAPPLLARFQNGLLYGYIVGQVCTPQDLVKDTVWRAVARRLGEWHARLPVDSVAPVNRAARHLNGHGHEPNGVGATPPHPDSVRTRAAATLDIWSVMQKWTSALPCDTAKQQARKERLQTELDRSWRDLDNDRGPGANGVVFGHCDLLSANVIMLPSGSGSGSAACSTGAPDLQVSFIDYEYATPCPAAFDIANHFAEWGGYDCDYNMLPTQSVRRQFLQEYLTSFQAHSDTHIADDMLAVLEGEIDRYRGMPGLYWGIWALIQATISQIDFDYASYAEVRLDEYFAWRAQEKATQDGQGTDIPLRERRWVEE